jgi:hypothetical protein
MSELYISHQKGIDKKKIKEYCNKKAVSPQLYRSKAEC